MKALSISAVLMASLLATVPAMSQTPTCPVAGNATMGCNTTIVINPSGTLTIAAGPSATPYDGSDDNLVGILNNSGATVNAILLSGHGVDGGIFSFDGDGVDDYLSPAISPNAMDTSSGGYGGPLSYFTNLSATVVADDTGMVNFIGGLADGAQTYFSLEDSFAEAVITPGPVGTSVTPEPSTLLLLGIAGEVKRRMAA
jgi:hypothetical protein